MRFYFYNIFFSLFFFAISLCVNAQTTYSIPNSTCSTCSGLGTYPPVDICDAKFTALADIYPSGSLAFGNVTKVAYYQIAGSQATIPIKIYMKTTAATTLTAGTWSNAISGATLVYSGNVTYSTTGWVTTTLTTPFAYSSNNLEILVECDWNTTTTCASNPICDYYTAAGNSDEYWTSAAGTTLANLNAETGVVDNGPNAVQVTIVGNPSGLNMTSITGTSAILNWSAPSGGAPASGYNIYYSTSSTAPTSATTPSASVGAGVVSYNISGLTCGTNYYVWVRSNDGTTLLPWIALPSGFFSTSACCTPPGTQASGVSTSSPTNGGFNVSWTAGNGNGDMVVIRATSSGNTLPSSGTAYTPNTAWASAGQIDANNRVVFRAAGTSVSGITGLTPETQYTSTVYEYNTTGNCYDLTSPSSTIRYVLSNPPTAHAGSFAAAAACASLNLSWTVATYPGSGATAKGYIILQRSDAAYPDGTGVNNATAPASLPLTAGTTLAATIANGATTSTVISGLSVGTTYHFCIIPYTWDGTNSSTYNYYTAATIPTTAGTTIAAPTTQATAVSFSSTTSSGTTISWTNGNGSNRAVFMLAGSSGTAAPVNGTAYTANTIFGSGTQIGSTGWYCVYNGSGTSVSVTGLASTTTYRVHVCEYNCSGANTLYNTASGASNNPNNVTTTCSTPSAPASSGATNISCTSFTANWNSSAGASTYYLDVSTVSNFASFVTGYNNLNVGLVTTYNVNTNLSASTTYYYQVRAGSGCGTSGNSGSQSLTTTVPTPATPGAISGTAAQCATITGQVYSISAVTNATTYNWSVPTGWSITGGAGTTAITVTTGASGQNGNIAVTAGNTCGTSAASSLAVTSTSGGACSTGGKTYGYSTAGYPDLAYGLVQQTDGKFILGCYSYGLDAGGYGDALALNINPDGTVNWQRGVGSNAGGVKDEAKAIAKTSDGGVVIAGVVYQDNISSSTQDAYIVKLNAAGSVGWTRTIDGNCSCPTSSDHNWDEAHAIIQTADGGYAVAGQTTQYNAVLTQTSFQFYLARLDGSGNYSWSRHIGDGSSISSNEEEAFGLVENGDGTFILVGYTGSTNTAGGDDIYIVKVAANGGSTTWTRTIGGAGNEYGNAIIKTSDGKYVIVGSTTSSGQGGNDMYIAKLSSDATGIDWQRTFGGPSSDVAKAVVEVSDGYVMAGYTNSYGETGGGAYDVYVVKYDLNGNYQWNRVVGLGNAEYANSIVATNEGGFAVAGYTKNDPNSDILLFKIDASGNISATNPSSTLFKNDGNINVNAACTNTTGGTSGTPAFANTNRGTFSDGSISSAYAGTQLARNETTGASLLAASCGQFYSALPVELISFSASLCAKQNCTNLFWQTASEQNCDYFGVERSVDGKTWAEIGKVKGAGNSSTTLNYDFTDTELPLGVSSIYYRLKQTDFNGQFEYFGPVSVKLSGENEWSLLIQNPATDILQGTLFASENENSLIEIYDLQGRIIHSEKMNVLKGSNLLNINVGNFSSGIYFVSFSNSITKIQSRFVKMK